MRRFLAGLLGTVLFLGVVQPAVSTTSTTAISFRLERATAWTVPCCGERPVPWDAEFDPAGLHKPDSPYVVVRAGQAGTWLFVGELEYQNPSGTTVNIVIQRNVVGNAVGGQNRYTSGGQTRILASAIVPDVTVGESFFVTAYGGGSLSCCTHDTSFSGVFEGA